MGIIYKHSIHHVVYLKLKTMQINYISIKKKKTEGARGKDKLYPRPLITEKNFNFIFNYCNLSVFA